MTYEQKVKARFTSELATTIIENYCPHHVFVMRKPFMKECEIEPCSDCWKQAYQEEEYK